MDVNTYLLVSSVLELHQQLMALGLVCYLYQQTKNGPLSSIVIIWYYT